MDETLKELCQQNYAEHKDAIELIIQTINSDETSLKEAFQTFSENHEIQTFFEGDKELWFLPNSLIKYLPKKDNDWRVPYPIAIWISKRDDERIKFHLEVGPFDKGENRLEFINFLESSGYSVRNRAKRLESKYTRLNTNHLKIKDWSDKDELIDAVEKYTRKTSL